MGFAKMRAVKEITEKDGVVASKAPAVKTVAKETPKKTSQKAKKSVKGTGSKAKKS
jgi:hypothetical protein